MLQRPKDPCGIGVLCVVGMLPRDQTQMGASSSGRSQMRTDFMHENEPRVSLLLVFLVFRRKQGHSIVHTAQN